MSSGINHQYELESFPTENLPPFQFQKRFGEINWRKLSSIDLDRLVRDLDFVTLQENISAVTFCNVDTVGDIDPLFAKLLKLAQYTIEYLLHSQDYLQSVVEALENKVSAEIKNNNDVKLRLKDANADVDKYKSESKKRKKIIQQQQLLIESGASSFYQCPHCEKAFMNASFLQGHMQRRHPDSAAYIGDVIKHAEKEQRKLGDHIKTLEAELQKDRKDFEEKLTKANEDKLLWEQKAQQEMTDWKAKEEEKWLKQVEELRAAFTSDIKNLQAKETKYKETIQTLEEKLEKSQSNLGVLEDDYREEKQKIKSYGSRVKSLEDDNIDKDQAIESLFREIRLVKNDSSKRLLKQDNRFASFKSNVSNSQSKRSPKSKRVKPKPVVMEKPPILVTEADSNQPDFRSNQEEMIRMYKPIILQLLDDKLNKCGVDPLARGIAKTMLTNKLVVLKKERQQQSRNDPNYYQVRNSIKQTLEERMSQSNSRKKQRPKSGKKTKGSSILRFDFDNRDNLQSTPMKHDPNNRSLRKELEFDPPSPKLSEIKSPRKEGKSHNLGSLKDEFSSPWDSDDGDDDKAIASSTLVPGKDKTVEFSDWDDSDDESYNPIKKNERPQSTVKRLASDLDKKLKHQKPPQKGPAGGIPVIHDVQPFDLSDSDDLASISSQEDKPKPAPRNTINKTGTGSASGTSVWGSEHKASTGGLSTKKSDFDDLELSDFSD